MGQRDKLVEIQISDYTEYVKLSNSRRIKPYIQGKCRVPKKYSTGDYHWIKKGKLLVLARKADGIVLTSNPLAAGTPKMKKVNGQDIYNGNVSRQARATLVKALHNFFIPHISGIEPIKNIDYFPLTLEILFYIHDKGKNNIDNDNKWIYRKCIQDTLVELEKIADDDPQFISRNEEETILIPDNQEQRLIINIYKTKQI